MLKQDKTQTQEMIKIKCQYELFCAFVIKPEHMYKILQ